MLMSTIVAVALGLTPVQANAGPQLIAADFSANVGVYSHYLDRRGTVHLQGRDAHGIRYELVMDKNGRVEANVGEKVITFHVHEAA